jgi:hypothetical protein
MKKFIERYVEGQIAVHCNTEGKAQRFLELLEENSNIKWASGTMPTNFNPFDCYKENTCFEIVDGRAMCYCELPYFEDKNFEIVTFEELLVEIGEVVSKEENTIHQDEVINITNGNTLKIDCALEEGDFMELKKDEDDEFQILVDECGEYSRIVLSQEDARKLALVILANLDIVK